MSDLLSQIFDKFLGADCSPEVFERELLAVCSSSPDRAWRALALLDRYYRQHKISDRLCRALRQQIGAHAMRLEGHAVAPLRDLEPDPLFTATQAAVEIASQHPAAVPPGASAARAVSTSSLAPAPAPPAVARPDATALGDDGIEALLTTPTLPVARQPGAERAREPTAGERPADPSLPKVSGEAPPARWRRGFQTSPALGMIAVVLGVAASTQVRDPPERLEPITPDVTTVAAPVADSDGDPAVVSLSADRYLVQPHQRTVEFTVERTTGSGDASFVWYTQPSSARSSEDYVGTRARVVAIPDGTKSMTLQVPILANPQRRHIDMFYVVIGNADGGAELGAIRRAAVFIFPSDQN